MFFVLVTFVGGILINYGMKSVQIILSMGTMVMEVVKSHRYRLRVVPLVPAATWYNLPLEEEEKSGEKGET